MQSPKAVSCRFLLFARDTIRWRTPMDPDIHWSAMSGHNSTFIMNGGTYDKIFWTEAFNDGVQDVLSMRLVYEIYKKDFQMFRYDFENLDNKMPIGEIYLAEVHAKLGE
jgi:hypothetical protein